MIHPASDEGQGAGIGPVPLMFPPPPVPLRILPTHIMEPFTLKPQDGNTYQLTAQRESWSVVPRDENVFLHARDLPGPTHSWSVQPSGSGNYRVQVPNNDQVWTFFRDDMPQVQLKPANGSQEQNWKFVRIERD
ncbi:hypothetical protein RSOL_250720, partial [Rhizoctonia solani AG-3 Rhs1AP]